MGNTVDGQLKRIGGNNIIPPCRDFRKGVGNDGQQPFGGREHLDGFQDNFDNVYVHHHLGTFNGVVR
jgi:hypothetical protein